MAATWSVSGDLNTGRFGLGGAGSKDAGLSFGGYWNFVTTEEYNATLINGKHRSVSGGIIFNGKSLVGDFENGKIYELDMDVYTDNGAAITRTRRTQIINRERVNVIHNRIELEFEAGVGLDVASGVDGYDPQATLKWSDDGGNTWSTGRSVSIGKYEEFDTRAYWWQLGISRNRIYELTIESPVKVVLLGSTANLKACKV